KIPQGLTHGVAAKFFEGAPGQSKSNHGFGRNSGGWDDTNVRALVCRPHRFAGGEIDGLKRTPQGGNRLQIAAHADLFSIGNAAFNSASVVVGAGKGCKTGAVTVTNFIVNGGARRSSGGNAGADLHRLHRLQRHNRSGQQGIETLIPLRVRAQPGWNAVGDYLEDSAQGITCLEYFVDFFFHALLNVHISTIQQDFVLFVKRVNLLPRNFFLYRHIANGNDMAEDIDAKLAQEGFGDSSDRHSSG